MDKPWFDPQTGMLLLDEYVLAMPSFQRIMEDEIVSDDELLEHAERTTELLKALDRRLSGELREVATEALCELAVLYALQRRHSEQAVLTETSLRS